jgi:hypothetical protein
MRLSIIGQFGPAELGSFFTRAFRALGHHVTEVDQLKGVSSVRFRLASGRLGEGVGAVARRAIEDAAVNAIPGSDLVLVLKGTLLSRRFFERLRRRSSAAVVVFNPDDPFNMNGSSSFRHILECIDQPDLQLIWSRALADALRRAGARRADFLAFGVDESVFRPVSLSADEEERLGARVAFVGNWDPERERWLAAIADCGLGIWGNDWWRARGKRLLTVWRGPAVYGEKLLKVIAATRIHVNLLRKQNSGGHNMRVFELPACRRLQLIQASADLEGLFERGREILTFMDEDDLRRQVLSLQDDATTVERVACAGYARSAGHSYRERAREILRMVERVKTQGGSNEELRTLKKAARDAGTEIG